MDIKALALAVVLFCFGVFIVLGCAMGNTYAASSLAGLFIVIFIGLIYKGIITDTDYIKYKEKK